MPYRAAAATAPGATGAGLEGGARQAGGAEGAKGGMSLSSLLTVLRGNTTATSLTMQGGAKFMLSMDDWKSRVSRLQPPQ